MSEFIENALNLIMSTAERSGNLKKELKQTVFETLSNLRNLIVMLKYSRDGKSITISELEGRVAQMKAELEACRGGKAKAHGGPSVIISQEPARMTAR